MIFGENTTTVVNRVDLDRICFNNDNKESIEVFEGPTAATAPPGGHRSHQRWPTTVSSNYSVCQSILAININPNTGPNDAKT